MPDQAAPTGAVFLSYASEDADAAARICAALRAAGIEVWFDRDELRGGDAWDSKIRKQVHDCALFVAVISAHTNARTEGYFRLEWKLATKRLLNISDDAAFLMPVAIDDTPEAHARVPGEFLDVQWTRLRGGEPPPAFAEHVRRLLDRHPVAEPAIHARAADAASPGSKGLALGSRPRVRQLRVAATAVTALLVLGGGLWWYFQGAPNKPLEPATVPGIPPNSIAVLPFLNMSSDKEQEYLSDGLTEELLNLLATIPELRVAARTSSFFYKGKDLKLPEVARELQVAHLLEGSIRKSGNRLRITAQLIRGSDGYHEWSKTYDRTLEDVFAVQEEIATAVVSQLKIALLGTPIKARTTSPEAYSLFLQAFQLDQLGEGRFEESSALYRKVLELDPDYTPALLTLGSNYQGQADYGLRPLEEGMEVARGMYKKAIALDPDYGLAYACLGYLALAYDLDLAAAAQHFERALALSPTDLYTLGIATSLSEALGRRENLIRFNEYFVSRDPMDPGAHGGLAVAYQEAGLYDKAIASFRTALSLSPERHGTNAGIGDTLFLKGDYEGALDAYEREPSEPNRLFGLSAAHYALGHRPESDAALDEAIAKYSHWASNIACEYALRNDPDRAFEWLERAITVRDSGLLNVPTTIWFKNLHDDSRWLPFLRKIGRAPEQLAAIRFELKVPSH